MTLFNSWAQHCGWLPLRSSIYRELHCSVPLRCSITHLSQRAMDDPSRPPYNHDAVVLCGSAQRYRALMVILQSHRTQNMILRCDPNVAICYTLEMYQILSPVLFQQSLYFPLLIHRIFYLLVSALFSHALQYYSSRSFAPPKKWLFSMVTWGIKCART